MDNAILRQFVEEVIQSHATDIKKQAIKEELLSKLMDKLISEALEEKKKEDNKTVDAMLTIISKDIADIDKSLKIEQNKEGYYIIDGDVPHAFVINLMYDNCFDVTYYKNNTDRTKKLNLNLDELRKFVKEKLNSKDGDYVNKAFNKSAENSVDKESKKSTGTEKPIVKVEDMVEDKADLPNAEFKEVKVDKLTKQSDHDETMVKAKVPKQSKAEKKHVVTVTGKKYKKLNEETAKDTYFSTLGQTIDAVKDYLVAKGYQLQDEEHFNDVWMYSGGIPYTKTKQAIFPLVKKDGQKPRFLTVAIYRMDNGTYELTKYIHG